jgi:Tfp pilus assembly protein PilV
MNKHIKALTLVEIIVSVVILALVITGLANVFVAGKRYIQHSRMRMAGGELGKEFLDPLQQYVRQDTWDGNQLGGAAIIIPNSTQGVYTAKYTKGTIVGSDIKKVTAKITWLE